jgi:hypothetical protein
VEVLFCIPDPFPEEGLEFGWRFSPEVLSGRLLRLGETTSGAGLNNRAGVGKGKGVEERGAEASGGVSLVGAGCSAGAIGWGLAVSIAELKPGIREGEREGDAGGIFATILSGGICGGLERVVGSAGIARSLAASGAAGGSISMEVG